MKWSEMHPRERDALVGVTLFGWTWQPDPGARWNRILEPPKGMSYETDWSNQIFPNHLPHYTTDIAAAWEVFEKNGYFGDVSYMGDEYACELWSRFNEIGYGETVTALASTAPEAICIAALRACGLEVEL